MIKTTLEFLKLQQGIGNIIQTAYKYLKDNGFLLGDIKSPIYSINIPTLIDAHIEKVSKATATYTNTPILTYKNNSIDKEVRLLTIDFNAQSNKFIAFDVVKNATLVGAVYRTFDSATHTQIDTTATIATGGILVGGKGVAGTNTERIDLIGKPVLFTCLPGEKITITATSEGNASALIYIRIEEI